jgi:hypothetical protein
MGGRRLSGDSGDKSWFGSLGLVLVLVLVLVEEGNIRKGAGGFRLLLLAASLSAKLLAVSAIGVDI